ncbi:hypothetical protein CYLTODRAFT_408734 [Cylindrobasidium torrendii FP15055 ss-10]|uniref:F-box domain-containing protein n=1 Tax=Cylindrobasidium torrendii FP15055 ss-10 TaxID=1314674 RepID=A0A0D7BJG4_9AGAR|nr:hypothetical protein CYLTODRAFT_408734 [Cylindrobasidium torrendii FP15055 ss-10]
MPNTMLWSHLPLDIGRHILEDVALDSDKKRVAFELLLLSTTVRDWLDPILHTSLHLSSQTTSLHTFANAVRARGDAGFYTSNVKSLILDVRQDDCQADASTDAEEEYVALQDARTILQACAGVSNLAWWSRSQSLPPLPRPTYIDTDFATAPSLQSLSLRDLKNHDLPLLPPSVSLLSLNSDDIYRLDWAMLFDRCPCLHTLILEFPLHNMDFASAHQPGVPPSIADIVRDIRMCAPASLGRIIVRCDLHLEMDRPFLGGLVEQADPRVVVVPFNQNPAWSPLAVFEKKLPGLVYFLRDASRHWESDWVDAKGEKLWERVQRWREMNPIPSA